MADRGAKTALFDEFVPRAAMPASGRRIELVDVLANGDGTVEALAGEVGLSAANTSQHLQVLRRVGLAARPAAHSVHYRLAGPEVFEPGGSCGPWPPAAWPRSSASPPPTSAGATSWSHHPPGAETRRLQDDDLVVPDRTAAEHARRPPPPERSRSRSSCAGGWPSYLLTGETSPTAAAPIAPSPTRPSQCCARRASRPGVGGRLPEWQAAGLAVTGA